MKTVTVTISHFVPSTLFVSADKKMSAFNQRMAHPSTQAIRDGADCTKTAETMKRGCEADGAGYRKEEREGRQKLGASWEVSQQSQPKEA